jgi:predicted GNAT family acetyltransferase
LVRGSAVSIRSYRRAAGLHHNVPMSEAPQTRRNDAQHRYEIHADGQLAGHLAWRDQGGVLDLVHTEIEPAFEGRGLASQLVKFALDDARQGGRRIRPSCSYVATWLQRHAEYQDLVAA